MHTLPERSHTAEEHDALLPEPAIRDVYAERWKGGVMVTGGRCRRYAPCYTSGGRCAVRTVIVSLLISYSKNQCGPKNLKQKLSLYETYYCIVDS